MSTSTVIHLRRLVVSAGLGLAPVFILQPLYADDPAPATPKSAPVEEEKEIAKDEAKDIKDDAKDTAKEERDAAKEAAEDTAKDAKDAVKGTKDTTKSVRGSAKPGVKETDDPAKEEGKDAAPVGKTTTKVRGAAEKEGTAETRDSGKPGVRGSVNSSTTFSAQNVRSADIGLWFNRSTTNGLVVADVATTGAIAKLGFREGDRIITVNGQKVVRDSDFVQYLFADDVRTQRAEVVVFRGGKQQVILVEPAVFVKEYSTVQVDSLEEYGIIVDDRYTDRIVIWRVIPRSPAYYAGIRAGDVITVFNGNNVTTVGALRASVRAASSGNVSMSVSRSSKVREYQIDAPATQPADVERLNERREDRIEERRDERRENRAEKATEPVVPEVPAPAAPRPKLLPRPR